MSRPPYRCKRCLKTAERCRRCRLRKAEATRTRRARKRAAGICTECSDPAVEGMSRCDRHRTDNNQRSAAAHEGAT